VVPARENPDLPFKHLVDQTVLTVDAAGPAAGEFVPQRLRLANSRERLPLNFPEKPDDS